MKSIILLFTFFFFAKNSFEQVSTNLQKDSITKTNNTTAISIPNTSGSDIVRPSYKNGMNIRDSSRVTSSGFYRTRFRTDGSIITVAVAANVLGYFLLRDQKDLTPAELAAKNKNDIPFFDRGNAGDYSASMNHNSYIPFNGSFAIPVLMGLFNKNERANFKNILVMYLESEAITGTLYTISYVLIRRSRPLVYGTGLPAAEMMEAKYQRSFYCGHCAASATATFFAAKVFQDLNPDSKAKAWIWAGAAAIPAVVAYMRYKSGFHFLSDIVVGYGLGALSGILVPQWHKTGNRNVVITPFAGSNYNGMSLTWNLK